MSRVILCTGTKAKNPYLFKTSGVRVFTIEELCYVLKKDLDMLDNNSIDREMALFIRDELGLKERGDLLEQLVLTKSDLKSKLVAIFCSCDFFDEDEIRKICNDLAAFMSMSAVGRRKRKADKYLADGYVQIAQREYNSILADRESTQLSPGEYGAILHNLALIEVRQGHFDKAALLYREAYERNNEHESLRSYLYALKLGRRENEYIAEAMRLLDSRTVADRLEQELAVLEDNLEQCGELDDVDRLKVLYTQGRVSEFDRLADEMIAGLKRSYRTGEV